MFCVLGGTHSAFNRGNAEYTGGAFHAALENLIFLVLLLFRCSVTEQTKCIYIYVHRPSHGSVCALWKRCHFLLFVKQKIAGVSEVQLLILLRGVRRRELVMPLQGMWLHSSGFVCKMGYDSACLICVSKFLIHFNILQGKV